MKQVTGIGGIFFKAKDPAALQAWYREHLGIDVQPWGGAAFTWTDSGLVLQAAIEAAQSVDPSAVLPARRATDLMTFFGPIRFDARGVNTAKPMGLIQVQDGMRVMVAPV